MGTHEWPNYETWVVASWLRVDDWTEEEIESVLAGLAKGIRESQHKVTWELAEWLRERLQRGMPELNTEVYERLLQGAIEHVDWDALAEYIVARHGLRERVAAQAA